MEASEPRAVPIMPQKEGWLTPIRLLCLFCAMNMLVYLDRGTVMLRQSIIASPATSENGFPLLSWPYPSGKAAYWTVSALQESSLVMA